MNDLISREAAINAILHSAKNMRKRQLECTFDVRRLRKQYVSGWMPKPDPYAPTQSNDSKALDALGKVEEL